MNVFTPERVTLEMSRDTFSELVFALGIAAGSVAKEGSAREFLRHLALVNKLNEGNPKWTPYAVEEEKTNG